MRYEDDRVELEVPDDWTNISVVSFAKGHPDGRSSRIGLTSVPLLPGDTLQGRADAQVRRMEANVTGLSVLERSEVVLGRVPALQLLMKWSHPTEGVLMQLVTFAVRGHKLWTFIVTTPESLLDEMDRPLQRIMGSLVVRELENITE